MMTWRSYPAAALSAAALALAAPPAVMLAPVRAAAAGPVPVSGATVTRAPAARGRYLPWQLSWSTTFRVSARLGSFSWCDHHVDTRAAQCAGLPAALRHQWWAYPRGWPDTATERHYRVGGFYDPARTLWISHRMLHIRLWRDSGPVHAAAVVPKAAIGARYGRFVERWRVARVARGYKSAHLLWPQRQVPYEVDFPENEWDTRPAAYVHYGPADHQISFGTRARWDSWHTTMLVWTPRRLAFYLDRRLIGSTTAGVPHVRMTWILQNETALNGEVPPPHSRAQMDISYVAFYRLR